MLKRTFVSLVAAALVFAVTTSFAAEHLIVARGGQMGSQNGPLGASTAVSLRGGAMLAPRSAGLAGVDIAVPSVSLLEGWEGRLDADVIFKANFAEINTIVPVTLNQVHYMADVSGRSLYFGAGAGALLGGKAKLIGKGVLGVELNPRLGVEGNIIFTNDKTMVLVVGRLHL